MSFFNDIFDFLPSIFKSIDKVIPDQDLKLQLKHELQNNLLEEQKTLVYARSKTILAEMNGELWVQRSWRPILMLSITAIIINTYLVYPYFSLFLNVPMKLSIPENLWQAMYIGLGGCIVGRSVEKSVKHFKDKS